MSELNIGSLPSPAGPTRTGSSTSAWPAVPACRKIANWAFWAGCFACLALKSANILPYNAALILLVVVLLIIVLGRVVIALSRRNAE